jgi:LuxR family transcriptional regulator, maltose regulon positive regulatory protein
LQVGRETGLFGASLRMQEMLERISIKALEEGIEDDYVRELIRRNRLSPDPANPYLEQWPWPVKVHTLGRFGLLVDDRPVESGRKVQQKPLVLLKALIALGGRGVPEGRLAELLWPDADGDLAHHSFEVALSRLRKLLGKENALVLKEARLSLSNRQCWVDVWAFERLLGHAEKARKAGKQTVAIRLFEKAVALYGGPSFDPRRCPPPSRRGRSCGADSCGRARASGSVTRTGNSGARRYRVTAEASKRTTWPRSSIAV